MGDLVQDDAPDLLEQAVAVGAVVTLERPSIDGDLVRGHCAVPAASPGHGDALVETEERLTSRRLVLDHDRDVRHGVAKLGRERVERFLRALLEVDVGGSSFVHVTECKDRSERRGATARRASRRSYAPKRR